MTGRELIGKIISSCSDLDSDIPATLLHRDSDNCVIQKDSADFNFINGKLMIEMCTVITDTY